MIMKKKKILVFSNEAFSQSSSNGRTLMNYLKNIPSRNLAQVYIQGVPDEKFCCAYYQNSDNDALRTFLFKKKVRNISLDTFYSESKYKYKKHKRSYRNLVLRNIVWQSMRWWKKDFDNFLDLFSPEIVLLQAGDAPFMYAIAIKIAKKYNAKLVMFNTESYVLKKRLYASIKNSYIWHKLLMKSLKKQYNRFMKKVDFCIYNTEALEQAYQKKFPHKGKSCTLYTSSDMGKLSDDSSKQFILLYCGNLGVGRDIMLDKLAKALYEVDNSARVDIYGKFVNEESKNMLCSNSNVCYHGFVDYSEVSGIMSRASMLVHCENIERLQNLKYAFSTKIADSLACSRPFLVYATREYPFVKYLIKNNCAHIASSDRELKSVLNKCIDDKIYRNKYLGNASIIASKNHNLEVNCKKFEVIINQITRC